MTLEQELSENLPPDLPRRDAVIEGCARHLHLIAHANEHFNLTRITSPREAAVKHVADSLIPWRLFENTPRIIDAGTGAGYPGIPLALTFPHTKFVLADSTGKKARFVESLVKELSLENVEVFNGRAELYLRRDRVPLVTARAIAALDRTIEIFAPSLKNGSRMLLYKGPDAEHEIAAAAVMAARHRVDAAIVKRYDLPQWMGVRTIVELSARPKT